MALGAAALTMATTPLLPVGLPLLVAAIVSAALVTVIRSGEAAP